MLWKNRKNYRVSKKPKIKLRKKVISLNTQEI